MSDYSKALLYDLIDDSFIIAGGVKHTDSVSMVVEITERELREDEVYVGKGLKLHVLDNQAGVTVYTCRATYVQSMLVHLADFVKLEHIQRRKDLKIPISGEGFINQLKYTFEKGIEKTTLVTPPIPISYKDISAGGIGFECTKLLDDTSMYQVIFSHGRSPIVLRLSIIRTFTGNENEMGEQLYTYGCQFLDLTLAQEEVIRAYVFQAQMRRIKT